MWVRKLRSLPWRVIMLAILLNTFLLAIWWLGYSTGHDRASADGQAALSRLQADFDGYRAEQARREVAALYWRTKPRVNTHSMGWLLPFSSI
ncbi:hypothetical protein QU862_33770, partial [Escherichia coli]|nr:hypothetical protein [Escherichia coli]